MAACCTSPRPTCSQPTPPSCSVGAHWAGSQKVHLGQLSVAVGHRPGRELLRPPLDQEVEQLVVRLARENPRWGYQPIKGEPLRLGVRISATAIRMTLRHDGGLDPPPRRSSSTWSAFLRQQAADIVAGDFFTVDTLWCVGRDASAEQCNRLTLRSVDRRAYPPIFLVEPKGQEAHTVLCAGLLHRATRCGLCMASWPGVGSQQTRPREGTMTERVPEPRRRVTEEMRDPDTPGTVEVEASARAPEEDPTLEVEVDPDRTGPAQHRLVTIGDSLTHGFQSGAIFNTDLS